MLQKKKNRFAIWVLLILTLQLLLFTGCKRIKPTQTTSAPTQTVSTTAVLPTAQATKPQEAKPETTVAETKEAPTASPTEVPTTSAAVTEVPSTKESVSTKPTTNAGQPSSETQPNSGKQEGVTVTENGTYSSKDEVALYLHLYKHLPDNYITKKQAEDAGWDSSKGNLWKVAPGKSIGGTRFGNYEGQLPEKKSRKYYECDIDYDGGYRGAKRIIYSNDGLVFYTEDHYKTFEQLY